MAEGEQRPGRSAATEALAVGGAVALAYLILRTSPTLAAGAFVDDGVYLSLGRALAEGEGYRSVYAVGAPVHLKYPPALPAVYALLWWLGDDLGFVHAAALLLALAATACTAGILWWIARTRLELPAVHAAVLVLGPFLLEGSVQYFNLAISEPWFMLGWAGCLLLVARADSGWGWAVATGLLAGITALFRAQAVVLVPALAAALWTRTRNGRASGALLGAGALPILAWTFWHRFMIAAGPVSTQPDEATYGSWAPDSVGGAWEMARQLLRAQATGYWDVLPANLAPWPWLGAILWVALLVGFALGVVKHHRTHPALAISVLALGAVVFVWPFTQDRFVLATMPFAGMLAAAGYQSLTRAARVRSALFVGMALTVGIVAFRQAQIRALAASRDEPGFYFHPAQLLPANTEFVIAASRWVQASARPDDRLLTPLQSAIWLYTGRRGVNATPALPNVGPSVFDEPGRFLATRVLEDDVTLVLLWNPTYLITRDAATVQQACPEALEFLDITEEPTRIAVFRVRRDDPCFSARFLEPARAAMRGSPSATS